MICGLRRICLEHGRILEKRYAGKHLMKTVQKPSLEAPRCEADDLLTAARSALKQPVEQEVRLNLFFLALRTLAAFKTKRKETHVREALEMLEPFLECNQEGAPVHEEAVKVKEHLHQALTALSCPSARGWGPAIAALLPRAWRETTLLRGFFDRPAPSVARGPQAG
jgi:hypothetical protein